MKPLIGLTTHYLPRARGDYDSLNRGYSQSVRLAGGVPVLLPVGTDPEVLDRLDGLVFTGGTDLGPEHYGQEPVRTLGEVDSARDEWELALARAALAPDRRLPVLGICRGHQLLNVALGGTLWQDLSTQHPTAVGHVQAGDPMDVLHHTVRLEPDSLLAKAFGRTEVRTNSFHHQAVRDLAQSLRSCGETDGVNEVLEPAPGGPLAGRFLLGVQFHPEALTLRYPEFLAVFRLLVDYSTVSNFD